MIAISTTYMILHKLKYQPIGRQGGTGASGGSGGGPAVPTSRNVGDTADRLGMGAAITDAAAYTDATARLNLGLTATYTLQSKLNTSIVDAAKQITILEEREAKLTSAFKVGTEELALRTAAFSKFQAGLGATNEEMAQYRLTMEKTFGLSGKIFRDAAAQENSWVKGQITAFNYLSKNTNLSADQQASLQLYAAGAGRSLEEQIVATDAMAGSMEGVITKSTTVEEILQGVASLSSDIRSQYNKIPGSLEKAVLKSKQLGVSMDQLHQSGKTLLDIESSVGKEIEYQLLSGQRLVKNGKSLTNAYREATLAGNMEQQADIMKDVLETQSATLDGNNMLAKQALADSMGLQLKDLMYMNEKKHLQEQITESIGEEYDLNTILADPSKKKAFELELIDKSKGIGEQAEAAKKTLTALDKLAKSDENRRSPAENIEKRLASIQDQGLNVHITGDNLKNARAAAGTYETKMSKTFDITKDESFIKYLGELQEQRIVTNTLSTSITSLTAAMPIFGTTITTAIDTVADKISGLTGGIDPSGIKTDAMQTSPGTVSKEEDAVIGINDGVIKFNDKDKLTVVASPFGTMNEKVADKITNPRGGGSSVDMNSIVAAIQSALGNINITVALDPMAIDKEIKFRQGSLNS